MGPLKKCALTCSQGKFNYPCSLLSLSKRPPLSLGSTAFLLRKQRHCMEFFFYCQLQMDRMIHHFLDLEWRNHLRKQILESWKLHPKKIKMTFFVYFFWNKTNMSHIANPQVWYYLFQKMPHLNCKWLKFSESLLNNRGTDMDTCLACLENLTQYRRLCLVIKRTEFNMNSASATVLLTNEASLCFLWGIFLLSTHYCEEDKKEWVHHVCDLHICSLDRDSWGDYVNIIVLHLYVLCVYITEGYFIPVLTDACMVEFKGGEIMF